MFDNNPTCAQIRPVIILSCVWLGWKWLKLEKVGQNGRDSAPLNELEKVGQVRLSLTKLDHYFNDSIESNTFLDYV